MSAEPRVRIVRVAREYRVLAARQILKGESVLAIEGETTDRPSRYSVQIEERVHIEAGMERSREEVVDSYPWQFLNHSCDPNTVVCGREVTAVRTIPVGAEITFNYNTTEFDMAAPFDCRCGSSDCVGRIRGFKYLSNPERERLRPLLAEHLRRRVDSDRLSVGLTVPV